MWPVICRLESQCYEIAQAAWKSFDTKVFQIAARPARPGEVSFGKTSPSFYGERWKKASWKENHREWSRAVTNLLYRGINAPKLSVPESTPARLAAYVGDYWSEELRVVTRLEIHDGTLAVCLRSGRWIRLLPTGGDSFDTDYGGIALQFTRNAGGEV